MKEEHCPVCNHPVNQATNLEDENLKPTEGDITVCLYCASVLEFNKDLSLKVADADSIAEVDLVQLQQVQKLVKAYHDQ